MAFFYLLGDLASQSIAMSVLTLSGQPHSFYSLFILIGHFESSLGRILIIEKKEKLIDFFHILDMLSQPGFFISMCSRMPLSVQVAL